MRQLLRDIAEIGAGQGAPQGDSNYCDDGVPFVKAGNLQELTAGGQITEIQKVSDEVAKAHKLKLYPKGTVLFAKSGMSCLKGYVYVLPVDAYVVSHLACITPREDISEYLRLYFCFHKPNQLVKDAAYPSISLTDIGDLEIDTKDDQTRGHIISVLRSVEEIIELRKHELKKLDDLIKARFVEMFGNPVINDKGWDTLTLNEACNGIGDGLHGTPEYDEDGDYPFINGNNLVDGAIEITVATKYVNEETYKKHYIDLNDNSILVSINGTLGKLAFYNGEKVMLGKSACYCNLKPNIKREFVYAVMNSDAFLKFLDKNATASTIKNVGLKAMRGYNLIMPPDELQNEYIVFMRQVYRSKSAVQKALDEAQRLFDSLMQQFFGGGKYNYV